MIVKSEVVLDLAYAENALNEAGKLADAAEDALDAYVLLHLGQVQCEADAEFKELDSAMQDAYSEEGKAWDVWYGAKYLWSIDRADLPKWFLV